MIRGGKRARSGNAQAGFSLLEVLVAGAVLATALLGLATLATRGVAQAADTRDQLAAEVLLRDLEGRMALTGGPAAWRSPAGPDAQTLEEWRLRVPSSLPGGIGRLCLDSTPEDGGTDEPACDGAGALVAKLAWRRGAGFAPGRRSIVLAP